jgi:hypothetical protein
MSKVDEAWESMSRNLEEKTGKSLAQWVELARASNLKKHGELMKLLKGEYGLTHGYANFVALRTLDANQKGDGGAAPAAGKTAKAGKGPAPVSAAAEDDPVAAQYSGDKAALRPIYDAIMKKVEKFGGDVEVAPKKGYMSLRRNKQFGIIQPSTKTRVDVGLILKGKAPQGRLEASGSFNAMVTHRVRVEKPEEVDAELIGWLREAYESA